MATFLMNDITMLSYAIVTLKIIALMLAADFITGVVHFWMDQYGREDMPFVGRHVIEINVLHHSDPRHIIKNNYLQLTWTSWMMGAILGFISWCLGWAGWEVAFIVIYSSNANLIHKWTHQTEQENGFLVTLFQRLRLIQSRKHHRGHHYAPYDTNYCILTDWLNPFLHRIYFWEMVVWAFRKVGIPPVAGSHIRKFV